jgi:hypothetical protein
MYSCEKRSKITASPASTDHGPKPAESTSTRLRHNYLLHDAERDAIATAGQQRTPREHNYFNRMQELVEILRKYF